MNVVVPGSGFFHLNDLSEEEMLELVAITENYEDLDRLLKTERERICDFKPRPAVIAALLEKTTKSSRPADERHINAMRKIYESYEASHPPNIAEKFAQVQRQTAEVQNNATETWIEHDKKRHEMMKRIQDE